MNNTDHPSHLWAEVGPVSIDSNNLVPELSGVAGVLALLVLFKWALKQV